MRDHSHIATAHFSAQGCKLPEAEKPRVTGPAIELLNNPALHSAAQHGHLMRSNALAMRYLPDVAPFADVVDASPESLAALLDVVRPGEWIVMPRKRAIRELPGLQILKFEDVHQLLAPPRLPMPLSAGILELSESDVPEMRELADLTKPGPFEIRTFELGHFYGIRAGGTLIAMAGERMHPPGFCEVTAVCTHPDHRGAGHARRLIEVVQAKIAERDERPFLHVFSGNASALRLYLAMGYEMRETMEFVIAQRQEL